MQYLLLIFFFTIIKANLQSWAEENGVVFHGLKIENGKLITTRDIQTAEKVIQFPLSLTFHGQDEYPLRKYFNINELEVIAGKIIQELTLQKESDFYEWFQSLPSQQMDIYHYTQEEKQFMQKRLLDKIDFKDRLQSYQSIRDKISLKVLSENQFNIQIYNFAHSLINAYAFVYKIDEINGKIQDIEQFLVLLLITQ